tara:strand:- start:28 stop:135 length:108 start_codon:yes stop_codon:yes gene_type:complete
MTGFFASAAIANDAKLTNLKEGLLLKSWISKNTQM